TLNSNTTAGTTAAQWDWKRHALTVPLEAFVMLKLQQFTFEKLKNNPLKSLTKLRASLNWNWLNVYLRTDLCRLSFSNQANVETLSDKLTHHAWAR
ncbi:hypothetical protein ACPDKS_003603, partial [Vibrio cholerae]